MASRSKSLLFLQYRSSCARLGRNVSRPHYDTSENAGLIANEINEEVAVEMTTLPPKWVDVVEEVEEDMERIKAQITELEGLQKKYLLPGFDDRLSDEQSIDRLSEQIAKTFQSCQRRIKKVHQESQASASRSKQAAAISKNIQISLATKLQDLSGSFRRAQSAYLSRLRGQETRTKDIFSSGAPTDGDVGKDDEDLDTVFSDAQLVLVANNEREITERERAINDIVKSINGLAEIFKDLQTMVIDQGTVLDRIDYNIEQVAVHTEDAHAQLVKGAQYQNKAGAKLCIILLGIIAVILLLIVVFKLATKK